MYVKRAVHCWSAPLPDLGLRSPLLARLDEGDTAFGSPDNGVHADPVETEDIPTVQSYSVGPLVDAVLTGVIRPVENVDVITGGLKSLHVIHVHGLAHVRNLALHFHLASHTITDVRDLRGRATADHRQHQRHRRNHRDHHYQTLHQPVHVALLVKYLLVQAGENHIHLTILIIAYS